MALSVFGDKAKPPTDSDLKTVLGKTHPLWLQLQDAIVADFAPITVEWGFAGKAYGWGLRLKAAKRAVLYMTPCAGYFLASFALGEKAVQAAHSAKLPAKMLSAIDAAPRYAEGRGVRLEVRSAADLRNIRKLADIKMAN